MKVEKRAALRDLVMPTAVVAVVGMMIFPLPSAVLDVLLTINITFSLALLASAVYLSEPERFTALPTILLLTTLFRLGLNVSTTRQILGTGRCPEIVQTFGEFVVSGNTIVGSVVFAIVTLVQFLVIAKGAERVAEVAARFTLDAMPGKQMSIDADVRAGVISLSEARERRLDLQRESKLFGALDGAMKFVKGDAIAGLIITAINISAGLGVGVMQQGLGIDEAVQKYTLFTIGDGLVSQIPALLVAVAAGIAVTRVSDKEGNFVGRDILAQLTREPQALFTSGVFIMALAFVPGLPRLPFLLMSGILITAASRGNARRTAQEKDEREGEFRPRVYTGVLLSLSPQATLLLQQERTLPSEIQKLRSEIFQVRGVVVPDVHFEVDQKRRGVSVCIHLNGAPLEEIDEPTAKFATTQASRNPEQDLGFSARVASTVREVVFSHLPEFVNDTQTRMLMEVHQQTAEDLLNYLIPEVISVTALTAILRQLVREKVSIGSLHTILQAIADYHLQEEQGTPALDDVSAGERVVVRDLKHTGAISAAAHNRVCEMLGHVRVALARSICRGVVDARWRMKAWLLVAELDHLLSRVTCSGLPLDPLVARGVIESVRKAVQTGQDQVTTVILTSRYARGILAGMLLAEFESVRVLAVEEITAEVKLEIVGEIGVEESVQGGRKENGSHAGETVCNQEAVPSVGRTTSADAVLARTA